MVLSGDFSAAFWALSGLWVGLVRDWGRECMAGMELLCIYVRVFVFD